MKYFLGLLMLVFSYSGFSQVDTSVWDIGDSLRHIPCYDTYCDWNNYTIHPYKKDLTKMKDSLLFQVAMDTCDFHAPITGKVNSVYGFRHGRFHYGIDIKLNYGDTLRSSFDGVCRVSRYSKSYGHVIVIRHNNGFETLYAHMTKRGIQSGDYVNAGDYIGKGGCTGRCSGAHLHYEIRYLGEAIDPQDIFAITDSTWTLQSPEFVLGSDDFELLKESRKIRYHTIRSGDTLYGIARKHGTSVSRICQLNGISKTTILRIGRRLRVS